MEKNALGSGSRKALALCLSLLLATGSIPASVLAGSGGGNAFAETAVETAGSEETAGTTSEYVAEDIEVELDGVTYTCDFKSDGTATVTKIVAVDGVTEVSVPSSIEYESNAYAVAGFQCSMNWCRLGKIEEFTIPGSIRNFGCSLQNSASLKKLVFSEGVEEISAGSMVSGCNELKEIVLPSSLKVISGNATFSGASALEDIELPDGVAFSDNIGSVFSDCISLKSITLPGSLTSIPSSMFSGCSSLESVSVKSEINSVGNSAFYNCTSLTEIDFPGGLTSIGYNAFEGCGNLTTIPDLSKVAQMGACAFQNCKKLTVDVDLSSLDVIPNNAFCYSLITVRKFSNSLRSIGNWAFIWSNIDDAFPATLEKIGSYACYAGVLPENVAIPDAVTSIGASAFASTEGVKEVTLGSGLSSISPGLFNESSVEKITVNNSEDDLANAEHLKIPGVEIT